MNGGGDTSETNTVAFSSILNGAKY